MEYDGRHLGSFSSSIIKYCDEVLIHKDCVSSTFRKHSVKNEEDPEFSFHIRTPTESSCSREINNQQIKSSIVTEEDIDRLKVSSKEWALHIARVSIKESKLCLNLIKPHSFFVVLKTILSEKMNYGRNLTKKQTLKLTSDVDQIRNLTEKRLFLLKNVSENLLRHQGYDVSESANLTINFSTKDEANTKEKINITCGAVINSATGKKETEITPDKYFELRKEGVKKMSEHKYWETGNEEFLNDLAEACVIICLTQVKPNHVISLDFLKSKETTSKGASFILYNCARIVAIRQKFYNDENYPTLPNIDEIDFDLLKDNDEWNLLFNFLLEYPALLERIANDLVSGKPDVHQLCIFLTRLCSVFSMYYRRVRILMEGRDHLLPLMFARLHLLYAVEIIFESAFSILNIKKIEYM